MAPKKKPKIQEHQVKGKKYLKNIISLLSSLRDHKDCPNRDLHYDEYVAYLLLYYYTPVITSVRGLQQVSEFKSIKKKLKLPRFSLGSFSEAGNVFDPELLPPIIEKLVEHIPETETKNKRLQDIGLQLTLVDGTLLKALPKMVWALWQDENHRAAKMHLEYDLLKAIPTGAKLTSANEYEARVLKERIEKGKLYVMDRGYADYTLIRDIIDAKSSFIVRLESSAVYEVLEECSISKKNAEAGVQKDMIVKLGSRYAKQLHDKELRVVQIHVNNIETSSRPRNKSEAKNYRNNTGEYTMLLATDQLEMDVEIISDLYRYRWQIELFFRWFKKILAADRLLSLSENGMTIVMYTALIASILITLWTGHKATKRTFEMICFYFSGWVDDEELIAHIERLKPAETAE